MKTFRFFSFILLLTFILLHNHCGGGETVSEPTSSKLMLYGRESIELGLGAQLGQGLVVSGGSMTVAEGAQVLGAVMVSGNVTLASTAQLQGSLSLGGDLQDSGALLEGSVSQNQLSLPALFIPAFQTHFCLEEESLELLEAASELCQEGVRVAGGEALAGLAPGFYDFINIEAGGRLVLSGGDYYVGALSLGEGAQLVYAGPSRLWVSDNFEMAAEVVVEPAGEDLTYEDFELMALLGELRLGGDSYVEGQVYLEAGLLVVGERTMILGSLMARVVRLEEGAVVSLGVECAGRQCVFPINPGFDKTGSPNPLPEPESEPEPEPCLVEICDGVDNDCDGATDENLEFCEDGQSSIPPDPVDVVPDINPTVSTTTYAATEFLYAGENPIQIGMEPETIEPKRTAVLRGQVLNREGEALPGVTITIKDHPEYGQTTSRLDGQYDLVVNGGGQLKVVYQREGFLSSQRLVQAPWQDYVVLPEVMLLEQDQQVSVVDLSTSNIIVAQGSVETDADGSRQATVFFKPETTATAVLPDGSTQDLGSILTVRATEATVGENGRAAMPASLPPTSAYTYAVDLSVNEAIAVGAERVQFNQPVPFYVENFLGFPTGLQVPLGVFNPQTGVWEAEQDGRIIEILSENDGMADLDITGDGLANSADELAALEIDEGERASLAELYEPGQSLWRVLLHHFSWIDLNYPLAPTGPDPNMPPPQGNDSKREDCANRARGSIIECQNQVLGEIIPVVGTPFTLNYRSDRVTGRVERSTVEIPLSGETVSPELIRIDVEIFIAGRKFEYSFPPDPNQSMSFTWDGLNAYEQPLQGAQKVTTKLKYVYPQQYAVPANSAASFGLACQGPPLAYPPGFFSCTIPSTINSSARQEVFREQKWSGTLDGAGVNPGLHAWSLDIHHRYDPYGQTLYQGDGERRSIQPIGLISKTIAGTGLCAYSGAGDNGDGGPAIEATLSNLIDLAVGPDGSIYLTDFATSGIRRIDNNGIITTIAGTGTQGYSGDGGPAIEAQLDRPNKIALGPDGSLYIADFHNHRIRRVDNNGIITTVAGTGIQGYSGDGGPAIAARLDSPSGGLVVGPDGSIYIGDVGNRRIRRVGPEGNIATIAGNGGAGYNGGDGGPATNAWISSNDLALSPDGSLYFLTNRIVRSVSPEGILSTIAGDIYTLGAYSGDGGLATEAQLNQSTALDFSADGSLYIADFSNRRVRKVDTEGIITTIAGNGSYTYYGDNVEGAVATATQAAPWGLAVGPDDGLYLSSICNISLITKAFADFSANEFAFLSQDSSELYRFSPEGRHFQTIDALNGVVKYNFAYDADGLLASITDQNNQITTIERDANGNAISIIAPFGQSTQLTINENDYLASITNPAGETHSFTYTEDGLLTEMTNPRGFTTTFAYGELGRLTLDTDPEGGFTSLAREIFEVNDAYEVTKTSALGRTTTYHVENLPESDLGRQWTNTMPDGTEVIKTFSPGTEVTELANGTEITRSQNPDSRFGMQAPLPETSVVLPSGLTQSAVIYEDSILDDADDLLSLSTKTLSTCLNGAGQACTGGRLNTSVYDAVTRQSTSTSAEGRQVTTQSDEQGRVTSVQVAGLDPMNLSYNADGQVETVSVGGRVQSFVYGSDGYVDTFTDALNQSSTLVHDLAGRISQVTLPDGQVLNTSYDANGNTTSLTPPGKDPHTFAYNPVNLVDLYTPPLLGSDGPLDYSYNLDKQLTQIDRADGTSIVYDYDSAGRLDALGIARGSIDYSYNPMTGQLSSIDTPEGMSLSFSYDGSLLTGAAWSGVINGDIVWGYNNYFEVTSHTLNGTETINYGYDNDGLLTQAGALSLSYDPGHGLLTDTTLLNLTSQQSYSSFGELVIDTVDFDNGGGPLNLYQENITSRDQLGRILERVETVEGGSITYTYEYDVRGHLINVFQDAVQTAHYEYDTNGNRTLYQNPSTLEESSATYDAQDRLVSYRDYTYSYTANGELSQRTHSTDGSTTYTYDELGNLLNVTLPGGTLIEYLMDGNNRRVGKRVDGALTQGFLYQDQLNPVAELDNLGNILSHFIYASKAHVPDYMIRGGVTYRIISDHLGSVRLVVDATTSLVEQRIDYDEFGNVINDTNPGFQPFGFAGGIYDTQTGLVRFGARDYDAQIGRWTAKDPIGFEGGETSLYTYAGSDPINLIDPNGLDAWHNSDGTHTVGRDGSVIPVGGLIGTFIENYVFSGYTLGKVHDALIDWFRARGVPKTGPGDAVVNIPTMLPAYICGLHKDVIGEPLSVFPNIVHDALASLELNIRIDFFRGSLSRTSSPSTSRLGLGNIPYTP